VYLHCTKRPANFDVDNPSSAETEMEARVVGGDMARLAHDFLDLHLVSVPDDDSGADRAAIAPRSPRANFDPAIGGRSIVAQQRRRLILIHDHDVEVTVVIEVAKGAAAAYMVRGNRRLRRVVEFDEGAVTLVAKENARSATRILRRTGSSSG
jgi:hypothetical protein